MSTSNKIEGSATFYSEVILHWTFVYNFAAIGLIYDFLLLHADSDVTNRFGSVVHEKMTELSNPPYNVFYYSRDVVPGQGMTQ